MANKPVSKYGCILPECKNPVERGKVACFHHRKSLPDYERNAVMSEFLYGLRNRCHPTQKFIDARDTAVHFLREKSAMKKQVAA
jgi:hypothetical protein